MPLIAIIATMPTSTIKVTIRLVRLLIFCRPHTQLIW